MSAQVVFILLIEPSKRDKMWGLQRVISNNIQIHIASFIKAHLCQINSLMYAV